MTPVETAQAPRRIVVITGLSGSGKSTALKALEDLGFYAVDNLPVQLFAQFVDLRAGDESAPELNALVMDLRDQRFLERFPREFERLSTRPDLDLQMLFLEAGSDTLVRRYSQTRRQHPLGQQQASLAEVIAAERRMLAPLRDLARQVLDTGEYSTHQLRREIWRLYSELAPGFRMQVNLMSFGFKYGVPPEADMVLDARFLPNPYYIEELRHLTGQDQAVVDFVFGQEATKEFLAKFKNLLDFLLPQYQKEGKTQLTLALGCTGGMHRSVALVEWLAARLATPAFHVTLRHRDLGREI